MGNLKAAGSTTVECSSFFFDLVDGLTCDLVIEDISLENSYMTHCYFPFFNSTLL